MMEITPTSHHTGETSEEPVEVSRKLLEKTLVADEKKRQLARVISVSSSAAVGPGENFTSNILRLKISVELTSGEQQTRSIITKMRLQTEDENLRLMYDTEIFMFEKLLPKIERQLRILLKPGEDYLWARFYGSDENNLFLEDLTESGYKITSRSLLLDTDHIILGLKALAKIHASTKAALSSEDVSPMTENVFFKKGSLVDSFYSNFFKNLMPHFQSHLPRWVPLAETLISQSLGLMLAELRKDDPEDLKVMNHGDIWRNNLMYKYYDGKPISIKLVDFQMNHYSSMGWDLAYFLHSSLPVAQWKVEIPRLLEVYREELARSMETLVLSGYVPSVDRLLDELSRLTIFSLITSIAISCITYSTSQKKITVEDLTTEGEDSKQMFLNPRFLNDLPVMLSYFDMTGKLNI